MKKYLLVLLVTIFIIPSIALASWWNPFSWKIFQKKEVVPQVQVEVQKTPEEKISDLQKQFDDLKNQQTSTTSPEAPVKPIQKKVITKKVEVSSDISWKTIEDYFFPIADSQGLTDFRTMNDEANDTRYYTKENNKWTWKNDGNSKVGLFGGPTPMTFSNGQNMLVCNYKQFSLCPEGKQFYCPTTGDASCVSPVATNNETDWATLETNGFTEANQKNWNSLTINNGKGEIRYYRKEGTQWVRKNSEEETKPDSASGLSTAEIEALLKQNTLINNQNILIANQNALIAQQKADEQAKDAETARLKILSDQSQSTQPPVIQPPSINCSNYQTEKNTLDEDFASRGMASSGARNSADIALDAKYASCF